MKTTPARIPAVWERSPIPALLTGDQTAGIIEKIIEPTLKGCRDEGFPFRGILFLGLMMTEDGPKLLEYNVRFGDPETQAILIRLESDLVEICEALLAGKLAGMDIAGRKVIRPAWFSRGELSAKAEDRGCNRRVGYSGKARKCRSVSRRTARSASGEYITAGGRVLGVTATGESLDLALTDRV